MRIDKVWEKCRACQCLPQDLPVVLPTKSGLGVGIYLHVRPFTPFALDWQRGKDGKKLAVFTIGEVTIFAGDHEIAMTGAALKGLAYRLRRIPAPWDVTTHKEWKERISPEISQQIIEEVINA